VKKDDVSLPESIATEVSIKGADKEFVFDRTIKKRLKPVPRVFDVEYRLTQPAGTQIDHCCLIEAEQEDGHRIVDVARP